MNFDKSKNLIRQAINNLPNGFKSEKIRAYLFNSLNEIQTVEIKEAKKTNYINTFNEKLKTVQNLNMNKKQIGQSLDNLDELIKVEEERLNKIISETKESYE